MGGKEGNKEGDKTSFINKIVTTNNLVWVITILILIIIYLLSEIINGNSKALNTLSAASNMISIVLSVLAIIYAYYSGFENNRVSDGINNQLRSLQNEITRLESLIAQNQAIKEQVYELEEDLKPLLSIAENENNKEITLDDELKKKLKDLRNVFNCEIERNQSMRSSGP